MLRFFLTPETSLNLLQQEEASSNLVRGLDREIFALVLIVHYTDLHQKVS
jgi:hypothetical protein